MKLKPIYLEERVIDEAKTREHFLTVRKESGVTMRMCAAHMGISEQYLCCLEHGRRPWNKELSAKFIKAMNNKAVLRAVGE
jgi:hypothetical protein